jgi:hypothetical protein
MRYSDSSSYASAVETKERSQSVRYLSRYAIAGIAAMALLGSAPASARCTIDATLSVRNNLKILGKEVKILKHVLVIHRVGASGSVQDFQHSGLAYHKDKAVELGILSSAARGAANDHWAVVAVWEDPISKRAVVYTLNPYNLNALRDVLIKGIEAATTSELKALAAIAGITTATPAGALVEPGIKLVGALIVATAGAPTLAGYANEDLGCDDEGKEIRIIIGGGASGSSRTVYLNRPALGKSEQLGDLVPNALIDPEKIAQTFLARLKEVEKKAATPGGTPSAGPPQ